MSKSFITTMLADRRALVTGSDEQSVSHSTILDASEFIELRQRDEVLAAGEAFDAAVEAFFAPITEAAEAAGKAMQVERDDAFFVVIQEEEMGRAPKREVIHQLNRDTVILRMIESGNTSRLLWVGDSIEILAAAPATVLPVVDIDALVGTEPTA